MIAILAFIAGVWIGTGWVWLTVEREPPVAFRLRRAASWLPWAVRYALSSSITAIREGLAR